MMKEQKTNKKINVWKGLLAIVIFSAVLFRLFYVKIPAISDTELPYWNFILRLAGKEGLVAEKTKDVLVSVGYCLPFSFLVRNGMSLMSVYKIAILVNGFVLSAIFLMAVKMMSSEVIYSNNDESRLDIGGFQHSSMESRMRKKRVSSIYMGIIILLPIFYSQAVIMGPQLILALLTLKVLWYTTRLERIKENRHKIFTKIVFIFLFGIFISPLFLAIAIGWAIGVGFYSIKYWQDQKEIYKAGILLLTGIIIMEAAEYIVILSLQPDTYLIADSGVRSLLQMLSDGMGEEGILGLLLAISGKGVYLFVNTFGLAFLGIYTMYIRDNHKSLTSISMICMFLANLYLAAAFSRASGDAGLPQDNMLSITALLLVVPGAFCLIHKAYTKFDILKIGTVVCILSLLCRDAWRLKEVDQLDWASSGLISIGREFANRIYHLPILAVIAMAIFMIGLCFWIKYADRKPAAKVPTGLVIFGKGIAGAAFIVVVLCFNVIYVQKILSEVKDQYTFSYKLIGRIMDSAERPVYYYSSEDEDKEISLARLWAVDTRIISVNQLEDIEELPENAVLVSKQKEEIDLDYMDRYQRCYETDKLTIWENKTYLPHSNLKQVILGEKVQLPEIKSRNSLRSTYGARTTWGAGEYIVKVKLTVITRKKGNLGKVKVVAGSDTIGKARIKGSGKREERQTIKIRFRSQEEMENFRIVIQTKEVGKVEVNEVNVTKMGDYTDGNEEK